MEPEPSRTGTPLLPPWLWASFITVLAFVFLALHMVFNSAMESPPPPRPSSPLTVVVGPSAAE